MHLSDLPETNVAGGKTLDTGQLWSLSSAAIAY